MASESLDVRVRLIDSRLAQLEAQKTSRAISGIGKSAKKADEESKKGSFLGGMSSGVKSLIGMAGFTGLAFGIKDVTEAGLGLQASQVKVQNALRNAGVSGKQAFRSIQDQMETLSTKGGGSVEAMNAGVAQFVQQTQSVTVAERANRAAVQLSVKTGMDYAKAQQLIAGALAGRTRGLQKYLPMITPVKSAEDQLRESYQRQLNAAEAQSKLLGKTGPQWLRHWELIHRVTSAQTAQAATTDKQRTANQVLSQVLGQTAKAHESMQQKVADMRHGFQNLEANVGTLLIPALTKLVGVAAKVAAFLSKHKTLAAALIGVFTILATVAIAGAFVGAIGEGITALKGLSGAMDLVMANPWVLAIAAGIAVVVLLVTHFRQVKQVARAVWSAVAGAATAAWHGITGAATSAWHWIKGVYGDIKTGIKDVVKFIEGIATAIFNAYTWPYRKAFEFIKKGFNAVKGFLKGIPLIGGLFHSGGPVHRAGGGPIYRDLGGPSGTDTVPAWLTPGEYVLNRSAVSHLGMPALNQLNAGGGRGAQTIVIEPQPIQLKLDSRLIAESVTRYVLRKAARGPSSLVGGSLVAGSGGFAPGAP